MTDRFVKYALVNLYNQRAAKKIANWISTENPDALNKFSDPNF